ncbi:MAG: hypothetical protein KatS3mg035_0773 [Bacteroidia bacterium]|jgi:hypothetical protein|nr:MAG: hypothetical protein KatS3mg035_0773 [Bacteroidia bacterium]
MLGTFFVSLPININPCMKFFIFLWIYIFPFAVFTQDNSLEKFTTDIFTSITRNNYQAYDIYTVKKEDYPELNAKQNFKDENARKDALKNADELVKNHQTRMKEKFNKVQNNAKNAGIQWNDCKYTGYRIINKTPIKNGYKYDIALQFSYKGVGEYEIHLNDCYQLKKGWIVWKAIGGPW